MMLPLGFIENIASSHMLICLAIVLVLFGGKKLPELAHSLGRSLGEFKKGKEEGEVLANEKVKQVVDDIKKEEPVKVEGPKA